MHRGLERRRQLTMYVFQYVGQTDDRNCWTALPWPSSSARDQGGEWHERTHRDVLVVHQVLFRQRHRIDEGAGLVCALRIDQENHASTVAAGVPLANLTVKIELHRRS